MQADPSAQRALLLIADLDTQTAQLRHRKATLPEHAKLAELAGKRGNFLNCKQKSLKRPAVAGFVAHLLAAVREAG